MRRSLKALGLALVFSVSGAVAVAQIPYGAKHTPNGLHYCKRKLSKLAASSRMSRLTAERHALRICKKLRDGDTRDAYFFRAIVTKNASDHRRAR